MAHHHDMAVPKKLIWAAGFMMAASLLLAGLSRQGIIAIDSAPPAGASVVATTSLFLHQRNEGGIEIMSAEDGRALAILKPGEGAFARGVFRGLNRERHMNGVGPATPFALTRYSDGRLVLFDPATERTIELVAFGQENMGFFAGLLTAAKAD